MEQYIPKIHEDGKYVEILIQSRKCGCCDRVMIKNVPNILFPPYYKIDQKAQMKAAGIVYSTNSEVDGEPICLECERAGKANFTCALCNEKKSSNKKEESFGYPASFLCSDCYETVPAKIWDEKCEELIEEHQYD